MTLKQTDGIPGKVARTSSWNRIRPDLFSVPPPRRMARNFLDHARSRNKRPDGSLLLKKKVYSCVLKGEHMFKKHNFYIRAVEFLQAVCSASFLSPQQTCLDFDLRELTPTSLPIALLQLFYSKLFLNYLTRDTRR